jgi:hypothetical protein
LTIDIGIFSTNKIRFMKGIIYFALAAVAANGQSNNLDDL